MTRDTYDQVDAAMNFRSGQVPQGLLIHTAGDASGVWQIVEVWESENAMRRFDQEHLMPAIQRAFGDANTFENRPEETIYEADTVLTG
jgi:hypothetical protein